MGLAPEDGLPTGIQIMAPAREDARIYTVGATLEALLEQSWGHTLISRAPAHPVPHTEALKGGQR